MPTQGFLGDVVNVQELQQAFAEAPWHTTRFVKGAFGRFAKRVRRRTIQQMTGTKARGPLAKAAGAALFGGQFKQGRHVKGFVTGTELSSLKSVNKISALLRVHEEGATITPKQASLLFLSRKNNTAGGGKIFARVKSVTIPPRLHFRQAWDEQIPQGSQEVLAAAERAMRLSMEQRMKVVSSYVNKVLSHD